MAYPGMHTLKCKGCQSLAINYRCVNWASNLTQWNCQGCLKVQTPYYCFSCDRAFEASDSIPKPENRGIIYKRADGSSNVRPLPPLKPEASPSQAAEINNQTERKICQYCTERQIRCFFNENEDRCSNCMRFQQRCHEWNPNIPLLPGMNYPYK